MPKLTDSQIYTAMALAMFCAIYLYSIETFLLTIFAIMVSEVTILFNDYAASQLELYVAYLQYMKDHKDDPR